MNKLHQNIIFLSVRFIAVDLITDFLYWPVWWYTKGLSHFVRFSFNQIFQEEEKIGLVVWAKNIFKPMFAQNDWQGRIISFFMRVIMIIIKSLRFAAWAALQFVFLVLYITLPLIAIFQIFTYAFELF